MNSISNPRAVIANYRNADPPHLHLAAAAFGFPVKDGSLLFSEASSALARAAIRQGILHDNASVAEFQRLVNRLERSIGRTILDIESEAASEIRKILRLCIERQASPTMITEAARAVNEQHANALPQRCVDWLVATEIANA